MYHSSILYYSYIMKRDIRTLQCNWATCENSLHASDFSRSSNLDNSQAIERINLKLLMRNSEHQNSSILLASKGSILNILKCRKD